MLWGSATFTDVCFSKKELQVLHNLEDALLGTPRLHHPDKADGTRALYLHRVRQLQISLWMVMSPGVRICSLGHSVLDMTNSFMECLQRRHERRVRSRQSMSRKKWRWARHRSCEAVEAIGMQMLGGIERLFPGGSQRRTEKEAEIHEFSRATWGRSNEPIAVISNQWCNSMKPETVSDHTCPRVPQGTER